MKIINKMNPPRTTFSAIKVGEVFTLESSCNGAYMRTQTVRDKYPHNAVNLKTGCSTNFGIDTTVIPVKATLILSNEDEFDPP